MKIIPLILIILSCYSCKKSTGKIDNCTNVTVTLKAPSCKHVGIILSDGTMFACDDLPDKYAIEGNKICILFNFWDDPALCVCCGGTKISVIAVR
jgi:hypothetical protein